MATLHDLKLSHRLFLQAYPFRHVDWSPGAQLKKRLQDATLTLISTAGLYLPEQTPFNHDIRSGDCSFREIPVETNIQDLLIGHPSPAFDKAGALEDRNLVFPLDRLRELVELGEIGGLSRRHFSFMGGIIAPGRLIKETAPEVAAKLEEDHVDAVLLAPA
ncbi:MAG TPA: glycine/sarcosine/betaine reductase selenoprotein B family protein [Terriglobia bacterium]|nr:glycine/sarcosine/betaine reductase selenoprotein B family protein [Terriglobia bacterium]